MFTEAPEIPADERILFARERAVAAFPWTAAIRTASREAPVRMFRVIHARPNSVIPISRKRNTGITRANSTRLWPRTDLSHRRIRFFPSAVMGPTGMDAFRGARLFSPRLIQKLPLNPA